MKKPKLSRKLTLAKETIKELTEQHLTTAAGGGVSFVLGACSGNTICWSCGPTLCPSAGHYCPIGA